MRLLSNSLHWMTWLAFIVWAFVAGGLYAQGTCIEGQPFSNSGHWYRCILASPEPPRWGCE